MEKDFHYHLTYAAAKMTKLAFPEAVAYACQFVDGNRPQRCISLGWLT